MAQAVSILVEDNLNRAIQKYHTASNDLRFELLKRLRYGPKPSTKRRNKHGFRKDFLNPVSNRLSRSGIIQVSDDDRGSGKRKPGRHWW